MCKCLHACVAVWAILCVCVHACVRKWVGVCLCVCVCVRLCVRACDGIVIAWLVLIEWVLVEQRKSPSSGVPPTRVIRPNLTSPSDSTLVLLEWELYYSEIGSPGGNWTLLVTDMEIVSNLSLAWVWLVVYQNDGTLWHFHRMFTLSPSLTLSLTVFLSLLVTPTFWLISGRLVLYQQLAHPSSKGGV